MTERTTATSHHRHGIYRQQFIRWILDRCAQVKPSVVHLTGRVLGPAQPADAGSDTSTYRAGLVLVVLFLLGVAAWFAFELRDYTPLRSDDLGTMRYTNEILNHPGLFSPGSVVLERQLPLLQYFTYSSLVGLFGWGFPIVMVPFLFSAALALVVGYAAYKVTKEIWAFPVVALAMGSLPVFASQARSLPFYPPVLFFGYGGLIAAVIYLRSGSKAGLVGATAGLVGSLYSYNIGVLFLPVPILYLLIDHGRIVTMRLARLYAIVTLLAIPFVVWHLAVGGLDGFFRQDIRWMVDQGYLLIRNLEFVGSGSSSPEETLAARPRNTVGECLGV